MLRFGIFYPVLFVINRIGVYHESAVHLLRKHDSAKSVRESYFPEAQPEPCRILYAPVQPVAAAHHKVKTELFIFSRWIREAISVLDICRPSISSATV